MQNASYLSLFVLVVADLALIAGAHGGGGGGGSRGGCDLEFRPSTLKRSRNCIGQDDSWNLNKISRTGPITLTVLILIFPGVFRN